MKDRLVQNSIISPRGKHIRMVSFKNNSMLSPVVYGVFTGPKHRRSTFQELGAFVFRAKKENGIVTITKSTDMHTFSQLTHADITLWESCTAKYGWLYAYMTMNMGVCEHIPIPFESWLSSKRRKRYLIDNSKNFCTGLKIKNFITTSKTNISFNPIEIDEAKFMEDTININPDYVSKYGAYLTFWGSDGCGHSSELTVKDGVLENWDKFRYVVVALQSDQTFYRSSIQVYKINKQAVSIRDVAKKSDIVDNGISVMPSELFDLSKYEAVVATGKELISHIPESEKVTLCDMASNVTIHDKALTEEEIVGECLNVTTGSEFSDKTSADNIVYDVNYGIMEMGIDHGIPSGDKTITVSGEELQLDIKEEEVNAPE